MTNVEVVFTFDTTGSMAPCLGQVRKNVDGALAPLFKEMPNLKIGLCAHGDYCDRNRTYVTKWQNLTNDLYALTQFVNTTSATGGGDADECYELVLREARSINWTPDSRKILVVIGDANPHGVTYPDNNLRIDWRQEYKELAKMGVTIYSVQCLPRSYNAPFYKDIAEGTGGYHLTLDQFSDVVELIKAIVYKQEGGDALQHYEADLISKNKMTRSLDKTFSTLIGRPISDKYARPTTIMIGTVSTELVPVPEGRFQVLDVEKEQMIRDFVTDHDLIFKTGRGFYEFTKREEVQEKKEIVLKDRISGDMFTGDQARNIVGLPKGTRGKISPDKVGKYQVFIQSTSYNRKLVPGTKFLYEVDLDR